MLNEIISGVCLKLNEVFGDDTVIYKESIPQGFEKPCFFVQMAEPIIKPLLQGRYNRINPIRIQYFAQEKDSNFSCANVFEDMYLALEYITADGDLWRGTNMRGEFIDGVLTFFVNYNCTIHRKSTATTMGNLEKNVAARE